MGNEENCETNEKLKLWLSFFKSFLLSGVVTVLGLIINSNIKSKELQIKEQELIGTYIKYALTENIGERKRFSEYFAVLSTDEVQRKRWETYDSMVSIKYLKELRREDSLARIDTIIRLEKQKQINQIEQKALSVKEKEKEIKKIKREYNKKISEIENQLFETKSKLEVKSISENTQAATISDFQTLKNDALAQLIVKFLSHYSPDCFNASRIYHKGKNKRRFKGVKNYSITDIEEKLNDLYFHGVINKGKCKTKTLFSISNTKDNILAKFVVKDVLENSSAEVPSGNDNDSFD